MKLDDLPEVFLHVVRDEAEFLAPYESNWSGVSGLPGRREPHLVAAAAAHMRAYHGARSVLEDSPYGCPDARVDLATLLDAPDKWVWIEVKTMPVGDANDKLALVHGDLWKLERAAAADPTRNLPQAIAVVGFDTPAGGLASRFRNLAAAHRLDLWSVRAGQDGVVEVPLPVAPGGYSHAVVGVWARERPTAPGRCSGRCHLVRG